MTEPTIDSKSDSKSDSNRGQSGREKPVLAKLVFSELLAQVRKISPTLIDRLRDGLSERLNESLAQDLKTFVRHPRSIGTLIESRSAWLNRKFLGAASNLVEPFLIGMGFSVASLSEDSVEVTLPGFLRNQGEAGVIHNAALSALGEFAARIFWEHHLDLRRQELRARSVSLRSISRAAGQMRGVFRFPVGERESVLHQLRVNGDAEADSTVSIYDTDGRLVAEVDIGWDFSRQLSLSAPPEMNKVSEMNKEK